MKFRTHAIIAAALVASAATTSVMAQDNNKTAAAPAEPTASSAPAGPSEGVQKALDKRVKAVLDSLEGTGASLSTDMFSADFNKQATPKQVQQAMKQLHDNVGSCKLAGRINSPAPTATAYLLDCQKAYVPLEIGVEEKAPNKIQSLFFRASFWRLNK